MLESYITVKSVTILFFVIVIVMAVLIYRPRRNKRKIKALSRSVIEMTPEEFFWVRNYKVENGKNLASTYEFEGVYILYNETKNMYYVGQGQKVMFRINQHFTGHGNGDIYADYKYGDSFKIRAIRLRKSGFATLNSLEKHTIETYEAFSQGYNKTRGNNG